MDGSTISRWRFHRKTPTSLMGHIHQFRSRGWFQIRVYIVLSIFSQDTAFAQKSSLGCPLPEWWRGTQSPSELLLRFLYFVGKKITLSQTFWKFQPLLTIFYFNYNFFLCAIRMSVRSASQFGLYTSKNEFILSLK